MIILKEWQEEILTTLEELHMAWRAGNPDWIKAGDTAEADSRFMQAIGKVREALEDQASAENQLVDVQDGIVDYLRAVDGDRWNCPDPRLRALKRIADDGARGLPF